MTNEEAVYELKRKLPARVFGTELYCEAYEIAIDALEKADRYKLHDLRKNPNDLPDDGELIVYAFTIAGMETVTNTTFYNHYALRNNGYIKYIAWMYLPSFEEEEWKQMKQ